MVVPGTLTWSVKTFGGESIWTWVLNIRREAWLPIGYALTSKFELLRAHCDISKITSSAPTPRHSNTLWWHQHMLHSLVLKSKTQWLYSWVHKEPKHSLLKRKFSKPVHLHPNLYLRTQSRTIWGNYSNGIYYLKVQLQCETKIGYAKSSKRIVHNISQGDN